MGNLLSTHGGQNDQQRLVSTVAIGFLRAGPCTSTDSDRPCAIFERIDALNDCLRPIGLELIEVLPGRLSLAWYKAPWVVTEVTGCRYQPRKRKNYENLACSADIESLTEGDRLRALSIVQDVLWDHRCVVSVDVVGQAFAGHGELIADAIVRAGPFLKGLRIGSVSQVSQTLVEYLGNAIGSLSGLQELAWTHDKLVRYPSNKLLAFLRMTTTLTSLDLTEVHMPARHAATLFRALRKNRSLRTLCLSACLVIRNANETSDILRDYIGRSQCGLLSLKVRTGCTSYPPYLKPIVDGVCKNKKLQELDVAGFFLGRWDFGAIAKLLTENQTLRRITLIGKSWYEAFQGRFDCRKHWKDHDSTVPQSFLRCLRGIAQHKSLKELTVDISTFTVSECLSLCKAVHANKVLRVVTLARIHQEDVGSICRAIRYTDTEDRIRLDHSYVIKGRSDELVEHCNLIKCVIWDLGNTPDPQSIGQSLDFLPHCPQITSLSLTVSNTRLFDANAQLTVAKFLETTTNLKSLELRLSPSGVPKGIHGSLFEALCKNRSLMALRLHGMRLTETHSRQLALAITGNTTMSDFGFFADESDLAVVETLLCKLASCFADNYTMLQLSHSPVDGYEYLNIQRIIRRNRALAMKASHSAVGATQRNVCARALEGVSTGQDVINHASEFVSTDQDSAVAATNRALQDLTNIDCHTKAAGAFGKSDIWRLAAEDYNGRMQLNAFNANRWRRMKELLLEDMLDSD